MLLQLKLGRVLREEDFWRDWSLRGAQRVSDGDAEDGKWETLVVSEALSVTAQGARGVRWAPRSPEEPLGAEEGTQQKKPLSRQSLQKACCLLSAVHPVASSDLRDNSRGDLHYRHLRMS